MTDNQRLGKYEIIGLLGKGGFATVHRAQDVELARLVALKVLDPLLTRDPMWVQRFRKEARSVAGFRHPRIVTIYDIGDAEGRLFIAMELIEGGNLADLIERSGAQLWKDVVRLVGEIAEALDYAHGNGVLHRDLKPANVLLDPESGSVITDFGFARILSDNSMSVTMSGGVVGTPAYIAPEVWEGEDPCVQTDVYALGCILYELVTRETLFTGKTPPAVMRAHFQPYNLPPQWPDGVPDGLTEVLGTALAQDPTDRYASAGELAQAVALLSEDALAEPYAELEAALAATDWRLALDLATQIHTTDPNYRDVAALEQQALDGLEQAARVEQAANWREEAEQALAEEDWDGAERAVKQWLILMPGDVDALTMEEQAASDRPVLYEAEGSQAVGDEMEVGDQESEVSMGEPSQSPAPEAPTPAPTHNASVPVKEPVPARPTVIISDPAVNSDDEEKSGTRWWLLAIPLLLVIVVSIIVLTNDDRSTPSSSVAIKATNTLLLPTNTPVQRTDTPLAQTGTLTTKSASILTVTLTPTTSTPIATRASPSTEAPVPLPIPAGYDPTLAANITNLVDLTPNELMRLGRGRISEVAYSPDGNSFAVATTIGVWIYGLNPPDDGQLIDSVSPISNVSWSPDGARLAGSEHRSVRIWDATNGDTINTIDVNDSVESVRWSPDGNSLAAGLFSNNTVLVWDTTNFDLLHTMDEHTGSIRSVSWSPDSKFLASGSQDKTLRVWEASSGKLLNTIETAHINEVSEVSWSPDGTHLATAGYWETSLRIWDIFSSELLLTLPLRGHITSVNWSPSGKRLASGSGEHLDSGIVQVWDVSSGDLLRTMEGNMTTVLSVSWSPDEANVVSGSSDIRVWDATSGDLLRTIEGHERTDSVIWSPDGARLASISNGTVWVWDTDDGKVLITPQRDIDYYVTSLLSWSSDGTRLASGSSDGAVRIWDTTNGGELIDTLKGSKVIVTSVSWSPDGTLLASGYSDGRINIWDAANANLVYTLKEHTDFVHSVSWSVDGKRLASGSQDETLRVWDAISGDLQLTLEHSQHVNSVSWSPNGLQLASGSRDAHLWDATTGKLLHTFKGNRGLVSSVSWSPDGKHLASGTGDVQVWDTTSGKLLNRFEGHTSHVNSVGWSPDGSSLVSSSEDGTIRIWDVLDFYDE